MSLIAEVRRRKILQVAAAYAVVAWLAVQIAATIETPLGLPGWFDTLVIALLAIGFPITLIISWAFNMTPGGLVPDGGAGEQERPRGRGIEYLLIGLLIVAVGWLVYRDLSPAGDSSASEANAGAGDSGAVTGLLANSVAVLPCDNLSPDPDDAYFALSIHEEILNRLARIGALSVISRTSMMRYVTDRPPVPEIARELNVQTVMECSVRYAGDDVLVTAQLIDPETDSHLWSDSYPGNLSDISTVFALQADIAMNIANALNAEFSSAEQSRIEAEPTESGAAYRLYLRAASLYGTQEFATREDVQPTLELLDEVLRLDPSFAAAHELKSAVYAFAGEIEAAREEALMAAALDPSSAAGLGVRARSLVEAGQTEEATRVVEQAVEANPSNADVLLAIGQFYARLGDFEPALRYLNRAATLDPGNPEPPMVAGFANIIIGDYETAERYMRQAFGIQPQSVTLHLELARILSLLNRNDEAAELLAVGERLMATNVNTVGLSAYAYAYRLAGRPDDARRLFERFQAQAANEVLPEFVLARASLAIEDTETALAELTRIAGTFQANLGPAGIAIAGAAIIGNFYNDPILDRPEFVEARNAIAEQLTVPFPY